MELNLRNTLDDRGYFTATYYIVEQTGELPNQYKFYFKQSSRLDTSKIEDSLIKEIFGEGTVYRTVTSNDFATSKVIEDEWGEDGQTTTPYVDLRFLGDGFVINFESSYIYCFYCSKYTLQYFVDKVKEFTEKAPKSIKENKSAEISLVSVENGNFYGITSKLKATTVNLEENYNDGFDEVNKKILDFLNQRESGIALLYGIAGSGKSNYIRHLVTNYPKKYYFITPAIAAHMGNPEFVAFLMENTDSVFILEDCEQILKERETNSFGLAVSNILNMSDGILSDIFNLKFICTFNSDVNDIDKALLREGRCYINYEFTPLKAEKVAVLNDKYELGIPKEEIKDMTLAEIYNYSAKKETKKTKKIGF
jgi:hypothetical protein